MPDENTRRDQRRSPPASGRADAEESPTDEPSHDSGEHHDSPSGPNQKRNENGGGQNENAQDKNKSGKPAEPAKPKGPPWYKRPGIVAIVVLVVIVAAVGGMLGWRHSRTYEKTDDAYIDVKAQRVSPQIAGRVLHVLVEDNQHVNAGDVLVEIDPADLQTRVDSAHAAQAQADAQVAQAEAERTTVEAQVEQARAQEGVAQANATNAARDLGRFKELRAASPGSVSQQQLDHAEAEAASSAAQLRAAQKSVSAAEAQRGRADKQIDAAHAGQKSAGAQLAEAELTLSYAKVKASVTGRIARKSVTPGNYVTPGMDLMAVVPREVYITANFKETQLKRMRRQQPVTIEVDSYPDMKLSGHIDSVQPATGQAFDILPSQNAAGNWVKVVQRIPVKIVLDQIPDDPDRWLASGMSVTVTAKVQ